MTKQDKKLRRRKRQGKKKDRRRFFTTVKTEPKAVESGLTGKDRILIGVPCPTNGNINVVTAEFCGKQMKMGRDFKYVCSHRPEDGRNLIILKHFLPSDYTHLFFLDSDTVPSEDAIDQLLAHNKAIVAGVYPRGLPNGEVRWSVNKDSQGLQTYNGLVKLGELPKGLFETNFVGGGIILVKREVFERLSFPWFYNTYVYAEKDKKVIATVSNDLVFSGNAREQGFKLWVDPSVECSHFQTVNLRQYRLRNEQES